nr:DUF2878 domain-containing protein [Pelagibaculum spongiae]
MSGWKANVFNALVFQLGWFAAVFLHNQLAVLILGFGLLLHWIFISHDKQEWIIIFLFGAIGYCHDFILTALGYMQFQTNSTSSYLSSLTFPPTWLFFLWLLFATTLLHSFNALVKRPFLLCSLVLIAGPANYLAGAKLGAVVLSPPMPWLLSVSWPIGFLLLHYYLKRR